MSIVRLYWFGSEYLSGALSLYVVLFTFIAVFRAEDLVDLDGLAEFGLFEGLGHLAAHEGLDGTGHFGNRAFDHVRNGDVKAVHQGGKEAAS